MRTLFIAAVFLVRSSQAATDYAAFGDSITGTRGASSPSNGYTQLMSVDRGVTLKSHAVSGGQACDALYDAYLETILPTENPIRTMMIGTNDANFKGAGSYEAIFSGCNKATYTWLTVPAVNKVSAQSCTPSGSWTADASYPGNANQSTTNGSTLTCALTTASHPIYIWYRVIDGNGGTFNYSIDGGAASSVDGFTSPPVATQNGGTSGVFLARVPGVPAGSHTVLITVTSATGAGNVVSILAVGSAPDAYVGQPSLQVAGVIRQYADARSADTAAYNNDVKMDVLLIAGDGLPVSFVDIRSSVNTSTDMHGGDVHPTDSGHSHIRKAFDVALGGAGVVTLCRGYPDGSPCDFTDLQTAVSSLQCGAELDIEPVQYITGGVYFAQVCAGNPITVTSMRKAWLPGPDQRISPSHARPLPGVDGSTGNIPMICSNTEQTPILFVPPASGWHLVGIGSCLLSPSQGYGFISLDAIGNGINSLANAFDDFVADRLYLTGSETDPSVGITQGISLQGKNLTVKNSFIKDIMCTGANCNGQSEAKGITGQDLIGGVLITNNYISASTEPIFTGGNQTRWWPATHPNYGQVDGFTASFNYIYKPFKWWLDPVNNPRNAEAVAYLGSSGTPCMKNQGESKGGMNATWQYNVHENSFLPACLGQGGGSMATATRAEASSYQYYPTGFTITDATHGTFTSGGPAANWFACPLLPNAAVAGAYKYQFYCRLITSVVGNTITIDPAYGGGWPVTANNTGYMLGWDGSSTNTNVWVKNSVFRNVVQLGGAIMKDFGPPVGSPWTGINGVTANNIGFQHNLFVSGFVYNGAWHGQGSVFHGPNFNNATNPFDSSSYPMSGLTYDHNTWFVPDALSPSSKAATSGSQVDSQWIFSQWSGPAGGLLDNFSFSNNISPAGQYDHANLGVDVVVANPFVMSDLTTSNAKVHNNVLQGYKANDSWCSGRCAGNIKTVSVLDSHFFDPMGGNFKLVSSDDPYAKGGEDGLDIGANVDQLPLINSLTVSPRAYYARIDWDLTVVNNSIPCVIEVSPSSNLSTDLGTYDVVNDLNPLYFFQPDTDQRTNPKLTAPGISGLHRSFTVGRRATVADDNDGTLRNLALTPGTLYWGRLMCGGDTRMFQFATLGRNDKLDWQAAAKVSIKFQAPANTITARISYGSTRSLGSNLDVTPDSAGNGEFQVPSLPGSTTFYQISFIGPKTVTLPMESL